MTTLNLSAESISEAIKIIEQGGLIVFPTDTVYGFLADTKNKKAINKIYKIKNRQKTKPLAVFVSSIKQAKEVAEINKDQEKILKKHWPGKYTFILKSKNKTIGIRIPNYKPLLSLLKKINKPLAQTSVNISGQPELNNIKDIEKIPGIDLIIDGGRLPKRKPSTIIDLSQNKKIFLRR